MELSWHYHGITIANSDTGGHKGCTWRPLDEHKRQNGQGGVLHVGLSVPAQVTCCDLQQHTQQCIMYHVCDMQLLQQFLDPES